MQAVMELSASLNTVRPSLVYANPLFCRHFAQKIYFRMRVICGDILSDVCVKCGVLTRCTVAGLGWGKTLDQLDPMFSPLDPGGYGRRRGRPWRGVSGSTSRTVMSLLTHNSISAVRQRTSLPRRTGGQSWPVSSSVQTWRRLQQSLWATSISFNSNFGGTICGVGEGICSMWGGLHLYLKIHYSTPFADVKRAVILL